MWLFGIDLCVVVNDKVFDLCVEGIDFGICYCLCECVLVGVLCLFDEIVVLVVYFVFVVWLVMSVVVIVDYVLFEFDGLL